MKENLPVRKRISAITVVVFLLALFLCVLLTVMSVANRRNMEQLTMQSIILEKSSKANETLSRLLYKTQTLSIFALKGYTAEEFERMAMTLIDDASILNMLIAPGGVVTDVYPLEGNEAVVGLDFFSEGAGNKEAMLARETGALVLGGPFDAVQGGQVIVGRLPVFSEAKNGGRSFWGLVSVTLKYPEVLDAAGLNEVRMQGFDYEIWRLNPDDGQRQTIAGASYENARGTYFIEQSITIQNAEWVFRIYPVRSWYEYYDSWLIFAIGLCISILIAVVVQNNYELKRLKGSLEMLSHTDPLTGISNRRHFMERARANLERSERLKTYSAVIMIDLDHFKAINDAEGHPAGDQVLRNVAAVLKASLRPYDLFGRYGGEEFIALALDIDENDARALAERMRAAVEETAVSLGGSDIHITASLGTAAVSHREDLDSAIAHADKALYEAKRRGRNRIVVYNAGGGFAV